MNESLSPAQLDQLAFFPLPRLVFLPGTLLPLHIFEPRYRAMIAWCVQRDSLLAVTCIREGHEAEQLGDPPVSAVCGVGRIVHHRQTEDGHFHVLLEGVARVRIVEEFPMDLPFRRARAELVLDRDEPASPDFSGRVSTLRRMIAALEARFPAASLALAAVADLDTDAEVVDGLGAMIFTEPGERQALLECQDLAGRLDHVEAQVMRLLTVHSGEMDA